MTARKTFSFTVLRLRPSASAGEFVNVGVALHCHAAGFIGARFFAAKERLEAAFPSYAANNLQPILDRLAQSFSSAQEAIRREGQTASADEKSVLDFAYAALPRDDSALQWAPSSGGTTANPSATLDDLFSRFVECNAPTLAGRRTDEDVWVTFQEALRAEDALQRLRAIEVPGAPEPYSFAHAWQATKALHCYVPISFDLPSDGAIKRKAYELLGRMQVIDGASRDLRVFFLVGPRDTGCRGAAIALAHAILKKAPHFDSIVLEHDAAAFAKREKSEQAMSKRMSNYSASER